MCCPRTVPEAPGRGPGVARPVAAVHSEERWTRRAAAQAGYHARVHVVLLAALLTACGSPPRLATVDRVTADSPNVYFRDITVFDGVAMRDHQDVLVSGTDIVVVDDTGAVEVPSGAATVDGEGRTLLPGLVDSHAHLFSAGEKDPPTPAPEAIAQAFLFAGVTSVLVAADPGEANRLKNDEGSQSVVPHLYTAGPGLSAPGGHPIPLLRSMLPWPARWFAIRGTPTAVDGDAARARVAEIVARDRPDFVKIVYDDLPPGSPHLSREALREAIVEARTRGTRPIVHATTPADVMDVVDAGASLLMHVPQRGVMSDVQVARLAASGIPVVTTVRLVSASYELAAAGPIALEEQMYAPQLLRPWIEEPTWNLTGFSEEIDRRHVEVAADTAANFRKLLAAGVPMFIGSDSGVHGVFPGASLHRELRLLVELGMPPLVALRAATSAPAAFLDPAASFGRVVPGQRADLLMVRGDPSNDIRALQAIEEVFLGGVRLRRHPVSSSLAP